MYFLYVDESGDPGRYIGSNTPHFILSGLIVPEEEWATGLPKKVEFHSSELIRPHKLEAYKQIHKSVRVRLLKDFVELMPTFFPKARMLSVCLDKQQLTAETNYQEMAWRLLLRGFDDFLQSQSQLGLVVSDDTNETALRLLFRSMRKEPQPITAILEDVVCRQSIHSYYVQAVDAIAFCLYQQEYPKGSTRKFDLHQLFKTLDVMLLKTAAPADPQGIIRA
ncbi:MAG: hypothetical protein JWR44_1124 [Hymenobacter sp.]|nr:hypothetical protein [Hymenobacter sp.]